MGMTYYKPLFVYLTPASIPQVVAHIQKYLEDTPIPTDADTVAQLIREYIETHPELIAVASVNGQTGNVVLTGSDININASQSVTIETQIANLASMIQSASGDITQIEAQLETIYTNYNELSGVVEGHTSAISGINTTLEGYGTRLTNVEGAASANTEKNTQQDGRLTDLEGNYSTLNSNVNTLSGKVTTNEGNIATLQNFCNGISSFAGLRIEFGSITVAGSATGGEVDFTFNQPFTTAPFVCFGVDADSGRLIGMHTHNLTNAGGTLIIRRILDGGTSPGWAGNAVVRYMAIGS